MRQRAKQLIRLCSRKKSVDQAVKAMQEEYGIKRSAVDRLIKKLNGLNINPIPIRRHAQPLPSLLTPLEQAPDAGANDPPAGYGIYK